MDVCLAFEEKTSLISDYITKFFDIKIFEELTKVKKVEHIEGGTLFCSCLQFFETLPLNVVSMFDVTGQISPMKLHFLILISFLWRFHLL